MGEMVNLQTTTTELRFYIPFNTKIGYFSDVLPSKSLSMALQKLFYTTIADMHHKPKDTTAQI